MFPRRIPVMARLDPIIFRELPIIQQIIEDETWYEGERRGCYVSPHDPAVRENVSLVILRIGKQLRESITAHLAASSMCGQEVPERPEQEQSAA